MVPGELSSFQAVSDKLLVSYYSFTFTVHSRHLLFDSPSDKLTKHSAGLKSLPFPTIVSTRQTHTFERESGEQLYVCSGRQ